MGTWHVAAGEAQNSNKLIVDIMHYIHCIAMLGIMYPPHPAAAEGIIGLAAWWHLAHLTPSIAIVRSCSSSLFVKVHKGKLVQIFWEIWHIFCHVGLQCYNTGPCHAGEMLNTEHIDHKGLQLLSVLVGVTQGVCRREANKATHQQYA